MANLQLKIAWALGSPVLAVKVAIEMFLFFSWMFILLDMPLLNSYIFCVRCFHNWMRSWNCTAMHTSQHVRLLRFLNDVLYSCCSYIISVVSFMYIYTVTCVCMTQCHIHLAYNEMQLGCLAEARRRLECQQSFVRKYLNQVRVVLWTQCFLFITILSKVAVVGRCFVPFSFGALRNSMSVSVLSFNPILSFNRGVNSFQSGDSDDDESGDCHMQQQLMEQWLWWLWRWWCQEAVVVVGVVLVVGGVSAL